MSCVSYWKVRFSICPDCDRLEIPDNVRPDLSPEVQAGWYEAVMNKTPEVQRLIAEYDRSITSKWGTWKRVRNTEWDTCLCGRELMIFEVDPENVRIE